LHASPDGDLTLPNRITRGVKNENQTEVCGVNSTTNLPRSCFTWTFDMYGPGYDVNPHHYQIFAGACRNSLYVSTAFRTIRNRPPVTLVQLYYTCTLSGYDAFFQAYGLSGGNAVLYATVSFTAFMAFLVAGLFFTNQIDPAIITVSPMAIFHSIFGGGDDAEGGDDADTKEGGDDGADEGDDDKGDAAGGGDSDDDKSDAAEGDDDKGDNKKDKSTKSKESKKPEKNFKSSKSSKDSKNFEASKADVPRSKLWFGGGVGEFVPDDVFFTTTSPFANEIELQSVKDVENQNVKDLSQSSKTALSTGIMNSSDDQYSL